jgi:hypothetical protein
VDPDPGTVMVNAGEVEFMDGATVLGTISVDSQGVAHLDHTFNQVGAHNITALYLGATDFITSNSTALGVSVTTPSQPLVTSTILAASTTSLNAGEQVTFTASVTGHSSGGPLLVDGSNVLFLDNGVLFASEPVNPATGTAVLTTTLMPGLHNITAAYFGDANYSGSTSLPVPVTVAPPAQGDVTSQISMTTLSIVASGVGRSRTFIETLFLQNNGPSALQGQLFAVVHGLRNGTVLRGATGFVGKKKKRSPFMTIDLNGATVQPKDFFLVRLRFSKRPNPITVSIFANTLS